MRRVERHPRLKPVMRVNLVTKANFSDDPTEQLNVYCPQLHRTFS